MDSNKPTILIVDDEASVRLTYKIALKQFGNILEAANIEEAREQYLSNKIDLAILDIMMEADEDGLLLLKEIKEYDSLIKVIMATGVEESDPIKFALNNGACKYINKPFIIEELRGLVEGCLKKGCNIVSVDKVEALLDYTCGLQDQIAFLSA